MESKIIKNLYFAGEIIDVDALTGGFNLQIAYSTGFAAGILRVTKIFHIRNRPFHIIKNTNRVICCKVNKEALFLYINKQKERVTSSVRRELEFFSKKLLQNFGKEFIIQKVKFLQKYFRGYYLEK